MRLTYKFISLSAYSAHSNQHSGSGTLWYGARILDVSILGMGHELTTLVYAGHIVTALRSKNGGRKPTLKLVKLTSFSTLHHFVIIKKIIRFSFNRNLSLFVIF
jgi:hypothetical protein